MSIEVLKSIFDIATVVLLFLTFLAGAGVLITGNIINDRQATQLQTFDSGLTAAKTELGKQQERAANADAAQKKVEIELSEQRQKTAEAELNLLELQGKLNWRTISETQRKNFLKAANGKRKGIVNIITIGSDAEARSYAENLRKLLKAGGWDSPEVSNVQFILGDNDGVQVIVGTKLALIPVSPTTSSIPLDSPAMFGVDLIETLHTSGIIITKTSVQVSNAGRDEVQIIVGSKPASH